MAAVGGWGARDPDSASHWASRLCTVGALLTAAFAIVSPPGGGLGPYAVAFSIPVLLAGLAFATRENHGIWPGIWVVAPIVGVAAVGALDLATADASAAGQVFLCYPVIYAASQLKAAGAALTAVAAVTSDAVVVFALEPTVRAVTDLTYVSVTLLTMTALLVVAGQEHDRLVSQLRQQAAIDPLTRLVTRRVLDDAAKSALASANTDSGTGLILLDVDRFKSINDTHGHPVGDEALRHVATLLTTHARPNSVVCRLGGDELAVLMPGSSRQTTIWHAREFVEALRLQPLNLLDGTQVAVSISAGVAHAPTDAATIRGLYSVADVALYGAKRSGRGQVGLPPTISATPAQLGC